MIVAIDGPAGVGKSTIAKAVAKKCNLYYLNSGSFYRAYTYNQLKRGENPLEVSKLLENGRQITLTIEDGDICIDGESVEDKLHTPEVDKYVSKVSVYIPLRKYVNAQIKAIVKNLDIITEGRDQTTEVFPEAELKFYFDAKPEIRAKRRYAQHPENSSIEQVLKDILKRDETDRNKPMGALKVADDACYIDTSDLTIDEVCEKVLSAVSAYKSKHNQQI